LSGLRARLTWTDNSANNTGFRVQRSVGTNGTFVALAQVGANVTTYTDRTVAAGGVYRYRVRAYNAAGPSAWSNTVSVVEP
jgi:fibronectin type 3 domain-containing protein